MQNVVSVDRNLIDRIIEARLAVEDVEPAHCKDHSLLSSCWQKAIRRGDVVWALRCVDALLIRNADYVWRRIRLVALEEVSIADLELVAQILSVAGKKSLRIKLGERALAHTLTKRLALATKCRMPCDLLVYLPSAQTAVDPEQDICTFERKPDFQNLCRVAASWRSIAAVSVRERSGWRSICKGNPVLRDRWLEETRMPLLVRYIVQRGAGTDQLNALLVPAVQAFEIEQSLQVSDRVPPSSFETISGIPAYAYCIFSGPGRSAIRMLLAADKNVRAWVKSTGATDLLRVFGYAVFYAEGVVCAQRITTPMAAQVRNKATIELLLRHGVAASSANRLLKVAGASLGALNEMRKKVAVTSGSGQT